MNAELAKQSWTSLEDLIKLLKSLSSTWSVDKSFQCVVIALASVGGDLGEGILMEDFIRKMPSITVAKTIDATLADLRASASSQLWSWAPAVAKIQGEALIGIIDKLARGVEIEGGVMALENSNFSRTVGAHCQYLVRAMRPRPDVDNAYDPVYGKDAYPIILQSLSEAVDGGHPIDKKRMDLLYTFNALYGSNEVRDKLDALKVASEAAAAGRGGAAAAAPDLGIQAPCLELVVPKAVKGKRPSKGGAGAKSSADAAVAPPTKKSKASLLWD